MKKINRIINKIIEALRIVVFYALYLFKAVYCLGMAFIIGCAFYVLIQSLPDIIYYWNIIWN